MEHYFNECQNLYNEVMTFPQDHTNFKKKSQLTRLMRQSPVFLNTQFIQTLETIGREEKKREREGERKSFEVVGGGWR